MSYGNDPMDNPTSFAAPEKSCGREPTNEVEKKVPFHRELKEPILYLLNANITQWGGQKGATATGLETLDTILWVFDGVRTAPRALPFLRATQEPAPSISYISPIM